MRSGVAPVEDVRGVVVARLRARRHELVGAIVERVRGDAFGRAGEDDAEYVAGLRAAVAAAVDYGFEGIERGEGDGEPAHPAGPGRGVGAGAARGADRCEPGHGAAAVCRGSHTARGVRDGGSRSWREELDSVHAARGGERGVACAGGGVGSAAGRGHE